MIPHELNILIPWIIAHGYLIFFVIATFEGPIISVAAGAAASLGYFNIYFIIILAVIGDIGGDIMYYYIGYNNHKLIHSKFIKFLGLTENKKEIIKGFLQHKVWRAVFIAKLSPLTGPIGAVIIGMFKVDFKKFFWSALLLSIIKTTLIVLMGYYFIQAYIRVDAAVNGNKYTIIGAIIVFAFIWYIYTKIVNKISKKLE